MKISVHSDIGMVRSSNQDFYYVNPDCRYCILADGMGGPGGGEVASHTAVEMIKLCLDSSVPRNAEELGRFLTSAIAEANRVIYDMAKQKSELSGMGTTVLICYFLGESAYLAHVGDSRAYKVSEVLRQITTDHSVVAELMEKGSITPQEAREHPQKNMITRAVGTDESVTVDIYEVPFGLGDKLLLCTDGLTNMVDENEILEIIKEGGSPKTLVAYANEKGGKDNVTVIIIDGFE